MLALYIVSGIVLFLVLILLIPVDLTFNLSTEGKASSRARVEWLFGLVGKDLQRRKRKVQAPGTKHGRQTFNRLRQTFSGLRHWIRIMPLAQRFFRAFKIKRLKGTIRFGLDDPVSTGITYGLVQSMLFCLPLPACVDFRIEPDFAEFCFEYDVEGRVRVYPLQALATAFGFVFSLDGWRTVRQFARAV